MTHADHIAKAEREANKLATKREIALAVLEIPDDVETVTISWPGGEIVANAAEFKQGQREWFETVYRKN